MRQGAGADGLALSVIVPVFNGAETLSLQLDALRGQVWDKPWEVLIVNNASTDATPEIAAQYVAADPLRFRLIQAPAEHNLSYVRNVGAAASNARALAFCDADDVVGDGWLDAIGTALTHHELVGSRLEYGRLNDMASSGASRFQSEGLESLFDLPCVSGAGLGCQRELWNSLGGNDRGWNATGEDFEFSMRASRDGGVEPVFASNAIYHYRLREDSRGMFRQNRRWGRSHVRLFKAYGQSDHRTPALEALKHSVALLRHIGDLRNPARRLAWARAAGKRLGRLEGSLRYRTIYL